MVLTKDRMTGFWTNNWWIPLQVSWLIVILENSCLRLGRRNEEETRLHCLSKFVSSPTAAITLSMISCRISIEFALVRLRVRSETAGGGLFWGQNRCRMNCKTIVIQWCQSAKNIITVAYVNQIIRSIPDHEVLFNARRRPKTVFWRGQSMLLTHHLFNINIKYHRQSSLVLPQMADYTSQNQYLHYPPIGNQPGVHIPS